MFPIRTKNRKAISVVMTTLIILVASVVLGTGVVLYGTSLFQTGGQTQSISSQGIKMWIPSNNTNGYAWGAAAIRNNGDVLVSVNTIQIRGVSVPFSNMYVDTNSTQVSANFQAQFISTGIAGSLGNMQSNSAYQTGSATCPAVAYANGLPNEITINESGQPDTLGVVYSKTMLCMQQSSGPTSLNPGGQMIVYFRVPNNILTSVDAGSSVTTNIFAGNVGGPITVTVGNS
jgi:hypothetical protein